MPERGFTSFPGGSRLFQETGAESKCFVISSMCNRLHDVEPPRILALRQLVLEKPPKNSRGTNWSSRYNSRAVQSRRDRKSTRLNSSHRCISYAVFCLKKK